MDAFAVVLACSTISTPDWIPVPPRSKYPPALVNRISVGKRCLDNGQLGRGGIDGQPLSASHFQQ